MELTQSTTKTSTFSERSLQLIIENKTKIHSYVNKALVVMILISSIGYIGTINDLSVKGFVLQEVRNKISDLEAENERQELHVMALESYEHINDRAMKLGMVKVDNIDYATIEGAVAKR